MMNRRSGAGTTNLNFITMKKLIALLAAIAIIGSISAQSKTAYLDLYQRGGAQHLRTTLMFNKKTIYLGKKNLGEVLNMLAESGWEIDKTLNIRRVCWFWPFTRHKFHLVLKKEYQAGENPFDGLFFTKQSSYHTQNTTRSESQPSDEPAFDNKINATTQQSFVQTEIEEVIPTPNDIIYFTNDNASIVLNTPLTESNHVRNVYKNNQGLISLGEKITAIPNKAFYSCQNLIQINLPEGISSIGSSAFYNCYNLETIFIPKTITHIGKFAFSDCFNLRSIYCQAINPPELGIWAFLHIPKNSKIYVPAGSEGIYKEAEGWKKYADQIFGYDF